MKTPAFIALAEIPYTAVLTKVDTICPATHEDIKMVYRSKQVQKVVQTCYELLNLNRKFMLPIQVSFHVIHHLSMNSTCICDIIISMSSAHAS